MYILLHLRYIHVYTTASEIYIHVYTTASEIYI